MSDELRHVLDDAADDPARRDPDLDRVADAAWARGRRRRARTRALTATGGVVAAGAALAVGVGVLPGLLPAQQDAIEAGAPPPAEQEEEPPAAEAPADEPPADDAPDGGAQEDGAEQDGADQDGGSMGGQGEPAPGVDVEPERVEAPEDLGELDVAEDAAVTESLEVPTGADAAALPTLIQEPLETFGVVAEVPDADGDALVVALGADGDWRLVETGPLPDTDDGTPWAALGEAAVDPAGARVALATEDAVLVVEGTGAVERTEVPDAGVLARPVWSPDGTQVGVGRRDETGGYLLEPGEPDSVVSVDGGSEARSSATVAAEAAAGWSIDTEDGGPGELRRTPVADDGSRQTSDTLPLGLEAAPTGSGPIAGEQLVATAVTEGDQPVGSVVAVGTGSGEVPVGVLSSGPSAALTPARVAGSRVLVVHAGAQGQSLVRWDPATGELDRVASDLRAPDPDAPPLVLAPGVLGSADD